MKSARSGPMADRIFGWLAKGAAIFTLVTLFAILASLTISAWPAIDKYGLGFLTNTTWDPVKEEFGGLVMIYGTLMTSFIALLIAVPVSFGIALFLTELSPAWLKRPLGTAIELLAAVPSIVYGMWGLLVFSPILSTYVQQPLQGFFGDVPVLGALFSGPPVGIGILSAGIILAIMIIPFIAAVTRDVFEVTPTLLKESAYGLGSTTWEVVQGCTALYQGRRHRRHHAWLGAGHRRDHGGHVRDRQLQPTRFAEPVSGRQQHHIRAGERVCRGG
jgi:phosphate transport system permease protein